MTAAGANAGRSNHTGDKALRWLIGVLAIAAVVALVITPQPNSGFASGAAVLTLVSTLAVGIERITEIFWVAIDRAKRFGGWWPLRPVLKAIAAYEDDADKDLRRVLAAIDDALDSAAAEATKLGAGADRVVAEVGRRKEDLSDAISALDRRLKGLGDLAPGSARFQLLTEAVQRATHTAHDAQRHIDDLTEQGNQALATASSKLKDVAAKLDHGRDIVASFDANPARRVASILVGSAIGLLIAGALGLNLFLAILTENNAATEGSAAQGTIHLCSTEPAACLTGRVGVLATGVLLGLGANPTHEVIKALRKRRDEDGPVGYSAMPGAPATSLGTRDLGFTESSGLTRPGRSIRRTE